jgi:abortive infection bacteriophage resistance protein
MNHFDDVYLKSKGEKIIDKWEEYGSIDAIEDDLFLFVIETHGAIEEYTTRALCQQIIKDSYSDNAFEYVYSDMSQYHREKLLSQCGILEDKLSNDLDHFRGLRNQIAHNRGRGLDWEDDDIEETIRDAIEVLLELRSMVIESTPE